MMKTFEHKGYIGSTAVSVEDNCLHGKIEFINDLVTYEGNTVTELKAAFIESVEDYLETCKELNVDPDKPYKGSLNIRLGSDLHRQAAIKAKQNDTSLNDFIVKSIENTLNHENREELHYHHHDHRHYAENSVLSERSHYETTLGKGADKWKADYPKH